MKLRALFIAAGLTASVAAAALAPQVAAASAASPSHATISANRWPYCLAGGASYTHDPGVGKTATIEISRSFTTPVALSWDAGSITVQEVSPTEVTLVSATPAAGGWIAEAMQNFNHPEIRFVDDDLKTTAQWILRVNAFPTAGIRITTTVEVCSSIPWTP
jgi:hypothetical protein